MSDFTGYKEKVMSNPASNRSLITHSVGIIADDLTGANDSGSQFSAKGLSAAVLFDSGLTEAKDLSRVDVVAIDTDSRALSAGRAYEKSRRAAEWLYAAGTRHIYKKIDSSLRGNWGAEVDAVMDVFRPDFAVIAPAFPRMGRTTRNGIHQIDGIPVDRTEMSRDPKTPVTESDLLRILSAQSRRRAHLVSEQELDRLKEKGSEWKRRGVELLVFDAERDEHLGKIARSVAQSGFRVLWVGSAGLAGWLPEALSLTGKSSISATGQRAPQRRADRVLVVAGSQSSVTKRQILRLVETNEVQPLVLDVPAILDPAEWKARRGTFVEEANKAFASGKDVAITLNSEKRRLNQEGWAHRDAALRIVDRLGELTSRLVAFHPRLGLVLTGGDTARAVCRHLGIGGIRLMEEMAPGIPLGQLVGPHPLYAVTKAGAFGEEDALVKAVNKLKGSEMG
ncbi:uncharacterized protein YgbK (DUF1537 family) [Planifilum fimeticola]|jgi:uncharacterized protein YgbK (DUF1537 family)|uniref:Uncharacterized protein YgbK (DUF1537 family) n=1 Tax=Planifilum fimeticola TaxID=201975 RepID=A0A2T0LDH5_9BACL|nr:four-carbon acid sugar kinase family protein [Planifilum fimeticola]PRX40123.1 uncharacterized protein YgbK (DUF1537 family) [Planifilum fimeticola]